MSAIPVNILFVLGIPPDKQANIKAAAQTYRTDLLPYTRDLNAEQRRAGLKYGPASTDFCDKTHAYTTANPQMMPLFFDQAGFDQTMVDYDTMADIVRDLETVLDQAKDTLMILGSQRYAFALAGYNGFQYAAKMKQPGADLIVSDLEVRFARQGRGAAAAARKARAAAKAAKLAGNA